MPEKRIGQILSLMNAERALELTNRLSSRSAK
jgi:flagellar motility protein MotE (MotC chaperone)